MKQQDAVVMENFPSRFYNSPHVQPPVVTKLRLNEEKLTPGGDGGGRPVPHLTEEDRKLEERLRRLKESHKPRTPAESEEALQERLARLRDEGENKAPLSSAGNQSTSGPTGKTQTEQADDLVDQISDQVRLDGKTDPSNRPLEDSISTLLSGMDDVQLGDEDPSKLLEDLQAFQLKQQQSALAEATSEEVQGLVKKAHELQRQEQEESGTTAADAITPYPQLPPEITVDPHSQPPREGEVSESEISRVLKVAQREMEEEEKKQVEVDGFVSAASKKLADLRGSGNADSCETAGEGEEVRSKLGPKQTDSGAHPKLDFSWSHFGGGRGGTQFEGSTERCPGETAARQLGITLSSEVVLDETTGSGDEVAGLLKQTLAEAALDRRLEEKGLDRYLSPKSGREGGAVGGGSTANGGATANYPSSSEVTSSGWGLDPDDLPWCCICNADAHIRCYDCDNDLYCTQCFSEGHEQFGLFDHKYAPFEPLTSRAV